MGFYGLIQQNRNPLTWRGCKIMPREVAECNALVLNLKIDPCKRLHHHHVQVLYRMLCVCLESGAPDSSQNVWILMFLLRTLGSTWKKNSEQRNLLNWGCAIDCSLLKDHPNDTHASLLVTVWNLPCPCHPPASAIAISMAAPVNRAQMSSNSCMIKMGSLYASWWLNQSIWKILVNLDHFPR